MKLLLFIALIPVALLAQQGSGARALLATSAAVAAPPVMNVVKLLTWDSAATKFLVYMGTNRASIVQRTTINTNVYPLTNGVVYRIAALDGSGKEVASAFWPSNRVGELWTQTSTNLTAWQDSQRLERFTNSAKQPAMFQRIVDKTVGWLPPN